MRLSLLLFCLLGLGVPSVDAQDSSSPSRVIAQSGAPITIIEYAALYSPGDTYTSVGIHHSVKYQNAAKRPIKAVEFGFVSFSFFNDFVDRLYGIDRTLPKNFQDGSKTTSGRWTARALGEVAHHTGVAWVNRIRFEDGEVWRADDSQILAELRKIQGDFDASELKPDKGKITQP